MPMSRSHNILDLLPQFRARSIPTGVFGLKLILLGNGGVGKTSLAYRFAEGKFPTNYIPTLGVNILRKEEKLSAETVVNWIIWDVGGQAAMKKVRKRFYTGTSAALLVLDKTNEDSYNAIEDRWIKEMLAGKVDVEAIPVIVIANKVDLTEHITVSTAALQDLAVRHKFHFIETSALTGENVPETFEFLAYEYLTGHIESRVS